MIYPTTIWRSSAVDKLGKELWEVRSNFKDIRIVRLLFTLHEEHTIAVHGVIKKSRTLAKVDLEAGSTRLKYFRKDHI